jgi:hypothetical protein
MSNFVVAESPDALEDIFGEPLDVAVAVAANVTAPGLERAVATAASYFDNAAARSIGVDAGVKEDRS